MNAKEIEVGFLEVVGNAVLVDVTKHHNVMDKLLKGLHYYSEAFHGKTINLVVSIYFASNANIDLLPKTVSSATQRNRRTA